MKTKMRQRLGILILTVATLIAGGLNAQSIWLYRTDDNTVSLEILKPDLAGPDFTSFMSSAWFVSGMFKMQERLFLASEFPIAYLGYDSEYGLDKSYTSIGNPYFGLEVYARNTSFFAEFGVRIPLSSKDEEDNALSLGALTDFTERLEAFATDIVPVHFALNYRYENTSGFFVRLRSGPNLWFAKGDRDDEELLMKYTAQLGYASSQFRIIGGISGLWLLSEDNLNFGERTWHQLGFETNLRLGMLQPAFYLRIPLDEDLRNLIDAVFGLGLNVSWGFF